MKPIRWAGGVLILGLIVLGLLIGWRGGWLRPRDTGPDAAPHDSPEHDSPSVRTLFDSRTWLWLQYPASGSVVPGDGPPAVQTPPELAEITDRLLWQVYAGPLHDPASPPPLVTVWHLKPPPDGDLQALGRTLLGRIEGRFGKATPLAAAVINAAGLGGIRINYALSVDDPDGRPRLLRFALLGLDGNAYLAWFYGPMDDRPAIDEIIASARFRRQDG